MGLVGGDWFGSAVMVVVMVVAVVVVVDWGWLDGGCGVVVVVDWIGGVLALVL